MIEEINIGKINKKEKTVQKTDTATNYGSGLVEVFATPAMIAFMEQTAMECVEDLLEEGFSTVGTHIDVSHIKATPVGMTVFCKAKLLDIEGSKLKFEVIASDEKGGIGSGTHTRFIIEKKKFMDSIKSE